MTRITNFGRKRSYLESSLDSGQNDANMGDINELVRKPPTQEESTQGITIDVDSANLPGPPPKKKRKRTPKSKRDGHGTRPMGSAPEGEESNPVKASEDLSDVAKPSTQPPKKSSKNKNKKKERKDKKFVSPSERRRLQRIAEKNADTTCFSCREKGHCARDCPKNGLAKEGEDGGGGSKQLGICYRCGSTRHTLSRCKKPEDPLNPLPHASCFVCNSKGHLASTCPQNKSKGIYPNGGSCKLCGDITHLARDCAIRQKDTGSLAAVLGVVDEKDLGADEDDFHTIGRTRQQLDRLDKHTEKLQRSMGVKVAAQSGTIIQPFGKLPVPAKKVVIF
ncbi:zf-cchc type zinc finger protein [Lentinula edodes]|uniref:Zf-cchc type zinc finger protein n=1 Tax=Lentinula edodes TaxID=5353 RepID=A0A1Q3EFR8_LENED|nr:zf-cchc type zinc finger protein [Lentinula edodes]